LQRALAKLRSGRYAQAERAALVLATDHCEPVPRAWLIVATARQRCRRHKEAAEAYQSFLASCASDELRDYVLGEIRACRSALGPMPGPVAPSRRLTGDALRGLAAVDREVLTESSEHFVVRARNAKLAKLLVREAEEALKRICAVILAGRDYPHYVEIYVWPDHDEYIARAKDAPEWSGGSFSIRRRDGVVTRRIDLTQLDEKGRFAGIMLDRVLPHEMCHLVIHEFFGDAGCPLFLNEGLAMMAEAEVDNDRVLLAGAALTGKKGFSLDRLFTRDRRSIGDPAVFYAASFSFVEFLHTRMTGRQFTAFLKHVKDGCSISDALRRGVYALDDPAFAAALEEAWQGHAILQAQLAKAIRGEYDLPAADAD